VAKTVLITGAHGFIGRHVARTVAKKGVYVIGLGHGDWKEGQWRQWGIAEWHGVDVCIESLRAYAGKPHTVIHCAGSGSVGHSVSHPYDDYRRTVATTAALLEFLRLDAPDAAFVYPSSAAVYGCAGRLPIAESDPVAPVSPYGVYKQMAEELCAAYGRHFGLKVAIVRLFSVYGNGLRKQLLWEACNRISAGGARFSGTGEELRDWLHVDDAVQLLASAVDHAKSSCAVFNGGTGIGTSVRQILEHVVSSLGVDMTLTFSGSGRQMDPIAYVADISRAQGIGWNPVKRWEDGVQAYVDWYCSGEAR
jgi:UDP-glucose 4-epimerase